MSIWDALSDGWNWAKGAGATIGGALSAAQGVVDKVPGLNSLTAPAGLAWDSSYRHDTLQAAGTAKSGLDTGMGDLSKANQWVRNVPVVGPIYSNAMAPATYVGDAMEGAIKGVTTSMIVQNPFDTTDWRNSWNKADQVTFGQATAIDTHNFLGDTRPGIADFSMDPQAAAARKQYYENTDSGKLESGILDFVVQAKQPLGKATELGVTAARDFSTVSAKTGAEEVGNALAIQRGEMSAAQGTGRSRRFAGYFNDMARNKLGGTESEILANNPQFKRSGIAASIVPVLADVNRSTLGEEEKVAFRTDVLGAAFGNADSWSRLAERRPDMAAEVNNFRSAPMPNLATNATAEDIASPNNPVAQANQSPDLTPEAQAQAKEIDNRLTRLNNFMSSAGQGFGQMTSFKPQWRDVAMARVVDSDILGGIGTRPIRVVTTSIMNRVPGGVAIKDVSTGATELQNILRQSYWTDKATRDGLMDRYLKATSPSERQSVVEDAAQQYNRDVAGHYGISPEDADYIRQHGVDKQRSYLNQAQSRMYSASPDAKTIELVDPDTGEINHVAKPLMKSQLEDYVSVPDPRQLDRAYRDLTQSQLLDHVIGKRTGEAVDQAAQWADDGLNMISQVWKNAQLMQVRYAARVQVDSQLRNAIYMSSLPYLHGALKTAGTGLSLRRGVFAFMNKGDDRVTMGQLLKGDPTQFMYNYMKSMGVDHEHIPDLIDLVNSTGGDFHALLNGTADHLVGQARATGQWGPTDWDHPQYVPNYLRAVNDQIRNSPASGAILAGHSGDSLWNLTKTDPGLQAEWNDLSHAYQGDKAQWLSRLEAAVHHLAPTEEAQQTILGRDITKADIQEWYPNGDGPTVHGEAYWPSNKNSPWARAGQLATGAQEHWYRMMSDAPDAYLARVQLFTYEFQKNFQRITGQVLREQNAKGLDSIDPELLDNIRRTAGNVARKRTADNMWNMSRSSNLTRHFRYVSPFFAAWEDTMKAYSGILYDKPWEGVNLLNAWTAPSKHGWLLDENGNTVNPQGQHVAPNGHILDPNIPAEARLIGQDQRVVLPLGWLPKAINPGNAQRLEISKNSLNQVFQGDPWWLPGTGPIVEYPVNELVKNWWQKGENNQLVKLVLPYGVQNKDGNPLEDLASEGMPTYIRDGVDALTRGPKWMENYKNAMAWQQHEIDAGKRTDLDPDAAAHQATWMGIMQTGTDNVSPVRVQADPASQFYIDMYHSYKAQYPSVVDQTKMQNYVQQYGKKLGPLVYRRDNPDADTKFSQDFPEFFALTASLSSNDTGIVATLKAADDYKQLKSAVSAHPEFGWAIIGPDNQYGTAADTSFSQAANDYLKAQGVRGGNGTLKSALDSVNSAEVSRGWQIYNQGMTQLRLSLEARGLDSFSSSEASDLQALKTKFEGELATENPTWGRDFKMTDGGKAVAMLDAINSMIRTKPATTQRGDVQALQQYIQGRLWMKQQLANRVAGGGAGTLTAKTNADLAQRWDGFTASLVQENIGFEMAYNRVLQHDDMSGDVK